MAEPLLIRLGERIRKLRKQRGWTQAEMAEKVGIDRSFLADVERGKRNISLLNLNVIALGLQNLFVSAAFRSLNGHRTDSGIQVIRLYGLVALARAFQLSRDPTSETGGCSWRKPPKDRRPVTISAPLMLGH